MRTLGASTGTFRCEPCCVCCSWRGQFSLCAALVGFSGARRGTPRCFAPCPPACGLLLYLRKTPGHPAPGGPACGPGITRVDGVPAVQASCIRFRAFACSNAPFAAAARGCLPQRNKGGGRAAAGGHSRRQAPPGRCGPSTKPNQPMPPVVPEDPHPQAAAPERFMRNQKSY